MSDTSASLPKLKVLAVDDNKINLQILSVFLKKMGHTVILAEDGQQAVLRFEQERPDMVLLDIMMPVMDGFEAATVIRGLSTDRWIPIIFLSALSRDENLLKGLEAGGDDYMSKPVNFVVLEAKIRSVQKTLELQNQLREALHRAQVISDNVLEAIFSVNERGIIQSCNQSAERMFGWTMEEMVGKNISIIMPEPHQTRHDSYIAKYLMGAPPSIIGLEREVEARRRDGSIFPAELGVNEVRLEAGARLFVGVMRDISERKRTEARLQESARQLKEYYEQTQSEQLLAKRLMEKQLHREGLKDERLRYLLKPASSFSGDVVAASRSPSGKLYILVADATGHGLGAAISALPVLAIFYRMTAHDNTLSELILELNQQLRESMPIGRFVAATLLCTDEANKTGEIWVGGMPEALLMDEWGRISHRFAANNLPLGIVGNHELSTDPEMFSWESNSQLVLFSDGLTEATNQAGNQFGLDGLLKAMAHLPPGKRFDSIRQALAEHLAGEAAQDDVSIMLVDCP